MAGEHDLYTITEELGGWYEHYSSVSEFKNELKADLLSSDGDSLGCVFWSPERDDGESSSHNSIIDIPRRRIQEKIIVALKKITSKLPVWSSSLLQFWASRVDDGRLYLTTLDQPFAVTCLNKGSCWYRKQCMEHYPLADDGSREVEVGPPVRVFRSGHPESSPDLCLYTTKEFPLRNCAAGCGFLSYMALPVFDLHHNHCVGVLEVLFGDRTVQYEIYNSTVNWFQIFNNALEEAEMRSTHVQNLENAQLQPTEIWNMLEWVIDILPQLHMAQVWVHCLQCDDRLGCMERAAFIDNVKKKMNIEPNEDKDLYKFIKACRFHNVQKGQGVVGLALSSPNNSFFCRNLCDFTISEYPMAHYAQLARLSFCFAIRLQSKEMVNEVYVVEFFLQSQSSEDAYIWYVLQVMEMKLNSFKIATGPHLGEELIVDEVRKKYAFTSPELGQNTVFALECEIIKHSRKHEHQNSQENTFAVWMEPVEGYKDIYSLSEFRESLMTDMSYLRLTKNSMGGWIFWSMEGEELSDNEGNINSKAHNNPIEQKVKHLLKELSSRWPEEPNRLIQFWAHKMIDNRSSLTTSDQPFALGFLCKGLCELRKQCMEHYYYVDDGAKDEELGPPGRVFLNGLPESTPDLRLYSTREFPLRNLVVFCGGRRYLVLPLFDSYQEKYVGVLEIVEFSSCFKYDFDLECIGEILKKTKLRSTHINGWSSLQASHHHLNTNNGDGQQLALMEIKRMFKLLAKTPQLHLAQVCVPCFQNSNIMQQAHCQINDNARYDVLSQEFVKASQLHQVHTGKGVCGRVLESKNKLFFCQNLCDFSIIEQPLAHYAQVDRLDTCFAIGLQSSHSKDSLYLLEFFLYPGSKKDGYPWSFVRFLLQIMKQNLTSFKVASGQQLGDELIVEVIKDYEYTSFKLDQLRFQVVEYGHQMGQRLHNQGVPFECTDSARNVVVTTTTLEGRITTKTHNKDRNKMSFRTSYNALKPHFGKKLIDVAEKFGVSKSTFKRACRDCGINRWPSNWRNKKNPSLFETTNTNKRIKNCDPQISMPSTSNSQPSPSDLPIQQNARSTQQVTKESAPEDTIIVKATFKDDIIKIQLRLSLGMEKLNKEVGERLKLKVGSFKLKYLDEDDGDWILLACDDDLHMCVNRLRLVDKTIVQVLVQLISVEVQQ